MTKQIESNLQKLENENSVVVIGGQQAGLLTGPLYSIHKMISIVLLAKQQETFLQQPVVPVFWVAGEDHDIQEVNHVFKLEKQRLVKSIFPQKLPSEKRMISRIEFDKDQMESWYKKIIASFGETEHTKGILQFLYGCLSKSHTYTEFFVSIVNELFKNYGLLLIDSAHPDLRKIESTYFQLMIEYGEQITDRLLSKQEELLAQGFSKTIETKSSSLQLFHEEREERTLLQYDPGKNLIIGRNIAFTKSDLVKAARENPEKFSNNVVTRPIMQEFLFPTIAFVAGPGEIAYWAELKSCFELFGLKIPPVFPRINISFLERNIESDINDLHLSIKNILLNGTEPEKQKTFKSLQNNQIETQLEISRQVIREQYDKLANTIITYDKGLEKIIQKNAQFVLSQLEFLKNKTDETIIKKHELLLAKFDRINEFLHPFDGLQERCWNVFYFLNQHGLDFIDRLLELPFTSNGNHYLVKL
jgi:bacillithiol biosynthesis cysteine-adding enzyme BshC